MLESVLQCFCKESSVMSYLPLQVTCTDIRLLRGGECSSLVAMAV